MISRKVRFQPLALLIVLIGTNAAQASGENLPECGPLLLGDPLTADCSPVRDRTQEFVEGPQASFMRSPPDLDRRPMTSSVMRLRDRTAETVQADDPPVPGGRGAGVSYESGLAALDSATLYTTVLFNTEGLHPDDVDMSFLMLPATNRMANPVELTVMYEGDSNGSLGLFARSCSDTYPCPGNNPNDGWQWFRSWESLSCNVFPAVDQGGHQHDAIRYANTTERLDTGTPPLWRNRVSLWNHCDEAWDIVYEHEYREEKAQCGVSVDPFGQVINCAWWGPIVETWDPVSSIDEVGFEDTSLVHDGIVSDLGPDETTFRNPENFDDWPYLLYHLTPNSGFGVGNRVRFADADALRPPTMQLDQLALPPPGAAWAPAAALELAGEAHLAQVVTAGLSGPLTKIDLAIASSGPVTVEVQSASAGTPEGDTRASQAFPAGWFKRNTVVSNCCQPYTHAVYFDSPAEVVAGEKLAVVVRVTNGDTAELLIPTYQSNDAFDEIPPGQNPTSPYPYSPGRLFRADPGNPNDWSVIDPAFAAAFRTYVGPLTVPGQVLVPANSTPLHHAGRSVGVFAGRSLVGAWGGNAVRQFEKAAQTPWLEGSALPTPDGVDGVIDSLGGAVALGRQTAAASFTATCSEWPCEDPDTSMIQLWRLQAPNTWIADGRLEFQPAVPFQHHLRLWGDRLLVTDRSTSEAAIYHRNGVADWTREAVLDMPATQLDQVALSDMLAVVGDANAGGGAGAVYVAQRNDLHQWSTGQELTPADGQAGDEFGAAVFLEGRWLAVGAPGVATSGDSGAVYLFEFGDEDGWTERAKLTSPVGPSDRFGLTVLLSGGTLAVRKGNRVIMPYFRNRAGSWLSGTAVDGRQIPSWLAEDAMSLSGLDLVVGAGDDDRAGPESGAAYAIDLGGQAPFPNVPPVAADDNLQVVDGGMQRRLAGDELSVLDNDIDGDQDGLSAYVETSPQAGSLRMAGDGTFTYTHNRGASRTDRFVYAATDRLPGAPSPGIVHVQIVDNLLQPEFLVSAGSGYPAPDPEGRVGQGYIYDGLAFDDDPGDIIDVVPITLPGWLTYTASAPVAEGVQFTVTGTPGAGALGNHPVLLRATDLEGQSTDLAFTIEITPQNRMPTANEDALEVPEGGTATTLIDGNLSVLTNDTDADGDTLTAELVSGPGASGTLTLNENGTFLYTHDGSPVFADSFEYLADDGDPLNGQSNAATVAITITPVNDPPIANSDMISVDEGGTTSLLSSGSSSVLDNDSDEENDDFTAVLVDDVAHGELTLNPDGSFTYTHDGSESFIDQFSYLADDGLPGNPQAATVSISVVPVNEPPEITTAPPAHARTGDAFEYDFEVDDPDLGSRLSVGDSKLPGWLEIDAPVSPGSAAVPANHVFVLFGTPGSADIGSTDVELVIVDEGGLEARQQFTLLVLPAAALLTEVPDSNFNGSDELALLRRDGVGTWKMELRDSGTGRPLAAFPAGTASDTALAVVPGDDVDGAGTPEISVLLIDDGTRQFRVDSFDALSGALASRVPMLGARYEPLGLATFGESHNVSAQVATLARHRTTGAIVVQVRAADTGVRLGNLNYLGPDYVPLAIASLDDTDGDGSPELAVLAMRKADQRFLVQTRNSPLGSAPRNTWFLGPDYIPLGLRAGPDADGNGLPELAVLARRRSNNRFLTQIRNVSGPANPRNLWMLNDTFLPLDFRIVPDSDNNGVFETAILGVRLSDGRAAIQWRNADRLGAKPVLWFLDPTFLPAGISVVPDRDGNGIPDIGVLGVRPGDLRNRMQIKNAAGTDPPADIWFSVP